MPPITTNISRKYYDFRFTVIEKLPFQDFSNINALGIIEFCLVKKSRSTQICHLCKPGSIGPITPMLHTMSPAIDFLVPEKKMFKGVLPYMGMTAISVM